MEFSTADNNYTTTGIYKRVDDYTIEITELPIGTWTNPYKAFLSSMRSDYDPSFEKKKATKKGAKKAPAKKAPAKKKTPVKKKKDDSDSDDDDSDHDEKKPVARAGKPSIIIKVWAL
jgi:hypothetical protein